MATVADAAVNAAKRPTARQVGGRWGVMVLTALVLTAGTAFAAEKVPADSPTPTAGYCSGEHGRVVTVTFDVDGPSVRCLQGRRGQELRVVNATGRRMVVRWARWRVRLAIGHSVTFRRPMGSYLAPGDHQLAGPRYYSAEVWMPGKIVTAPVSAG